MKQKAFIERDPLTNKIVSFLRQNPKNSYTAEELASDRSIEATTKQVQLVIALLMREGMIKVNNKEGKVAYQIKT